MGVPSAWRLENYLVDNVTLWFTGSSCVNGSLSMPVNATKSDKDRLWAAVSVGKAAGRSVFVYYQPITATECRITSFGLTEF
jgi:hypothetical protein